jgi:hypothetical protein
VSWCFSRLLTAGDRGGEQAFEEDGIDLAPEPDLAINGDDRNRGTNELLDRGVGGVDLFHPKTV